MKKPTKPCPFCGEIAWDIPELNPADQSYFACTNCGAQGPWASTIEMACDLTDRRVTDRAARIEALAARPPEAPDGR